jgi:uncharacterized membrane protein (DUF485 family)
VPAHPTGVASGKSAAERKPINTTGRLMARDEATALAAAHVLVRQLIAEKLKYLVPMTILFLVGYIGLTAMAGFAKDLIGIRVAGSVNLGFVLIALNYLLSWAIAIAYGRIAAEKFDPPAAKAAMEFANSEAPQ